MISTALMVPSVVFFAISLTDAPISVPVARWGELVRLEETFVVHRQNALKSHRTDNWLAYCDLRLSEIRAEMKAFDLGYNPMETWLLKREAFERIYRAPVGSRLPDRTSEPLYPSSRLETVFERGVPTDHIAVAQDGRIFGDTFNHGPASRQKIVVFDPANQTVTPFPALEAQKKFNHIHSLRVDSRDWLWLLDSGKGYFVTPALYAFDIKTGQSVFEYHFRSREAGSGSMLNDFVIDERRAKIYITDTSPMALTPALVVLDLPTRMAKRVLQNHVSVKAAGMETYLDYEGGQKWTLPGILWFVAPKIAVDGIAFDPERDRVYYAPGNSGEIYAIDARDLADDKLGERALSERVRRVAQSTMTDGMALDDKGRLYLTDREHSAIVRVDPATGQSETIVKDAEQLSWLSTLSFDGEGRLLVTSFPLSRLIFESPEAIEALNQSWPVFRIDLR